MLTIQLDDETEAMLQALAERDNTSTAQLIKNALFTYRASNNESNIKRDELKAFFKPYQKDMTDFKFDRSESNER